tara:strand:- start:26 stop:538 length:513 start_codon:yes stop_codon:yes gene_type:complete
MADYIMKQGLLTLVPADIKHVIPLSETLGEKNRFELSLFDREPLEFFMEFVKKENVYVVEKANTPLAIVGVEADGHQTGLMWAMFAEDMQKNWFSFLKASPKLVEFLHGNYYKLNMNILESNERIIQWAIWLGFDVDVVVDGENINYVHFVRCNLSKKNVYNLESRPVIH